QHPQRSDLAGHASAATALRLARRVDARQIAAQLLVCGELVQQAALETPAIPEEPVVRQRHVLRLRHLHRDRVELAQMGPTAELAAAGADAGPHPRGVAGADLAQPHARANLGREIAHEITKIDALLAAEEHRHPTLACGHLDVDDLHGESARAGKALTGDDRLLLTLSPLAIVGRLLVGREA